jgi:hypothetical protein
VGVGEYRDIAYLREILWNPVTLSGRIKWDSGHPAVRGRGGTTRCPSNLAGAWLGLMMSDD